MKTWKLPAAALCTSAMCGLFVASATAGDEADSNKNNAAQAAESNSASGEEMADAQPQKLIATAKSAGQFNTLAKALEAAGLVKTLNGDGPFTVFAPTDAAFEALPAGALEDLLKPENKEKLKSVLTYHVVADRVPAEKVTGMSEAKTVEGSKLAIEQKEGAVFIDDAKVTKTDVEASNGLIHVVDAVLMPSEEAATADAAERQPAATATRTTGYRGVTTPIADPAPTFVTPGTNVNPTLEPGETGAVERPGGGTNENAGRALRDSIRPGAGD